MKNIEIDHDIIIETLHKRILKDIGDASKHITVLEVVGLLWMIINEVTYQTMKGDD